MELQLPENANKETVLSEVEAAIGRLSLKIADADRHRPWGGFFVISKESEDSFISTFFPEVDKSTIYQYGQELSPKILVVAPNQKLSWQYHNRRAEVWKGIHGTVGVIEGLTDVLPDSYRPLSAGEIVKHENQVRHRLIGLDDWGVLAEIWQHTDPNQPSDEDDIIRLQDDYGRSSPNS